MGQRTPGAGLVQGWQRGFSFKLTSHITSHLGCCVWIKPGTQVSSQHR